MSGVKNSCFGFFAGDQNASCNRCTASRRCKAVLVSDGFDILGEIVETLLVEAPDQAYVETDRVIELIEQLLVPPQNPIREEAEELLGLVRVTSMNDVNLDIL